MKISCGIIRDLMPLYVDEICNAESKAAVEAHLAECEGCRACCALMRSDETKVNADEDGAKMSDGLKKLKIRMGKRMRIGIACTILAIMALFAGFQLLCVQALKELGPEDISVTAEVYAVDELPLRRVEDDEISVSIRKSEEDASGVFSVEIPAMPNAEISMTENVLDETNYITVINCSSYYHIRDMRWRDGAEENTLYVESIKTSYLKNSADAIQTSVTLEMRRIDKIVYVAEDGSETVMWEAAANSAAE